MSYEFSIVVHNLRHHCARVELVVDTDRVSVNKAMVALNATGCARKWFDRDQCRLDQFDSAALTYRAFALFVAERFVDGAVEIHDMDATITALDAEGVMVKCAVVPDAMDIYDSLTAQIERMSHARQSCAA